MYIGMHGPPQSCKRKPFVGSWSAPMYSAPGHDGCPLALPLMNCANEISRVFGSQEYFQHAIPLDRSGMTHFPKRQAEPAPETFLQETLPSVHRGGAFSLRATDAVTVEPIVQEKAMKPVEWTVLRPSYE